MHATSCPISLSPGFTSALAKHALQALLEERHQKATRWQEMQAGALA